MKVDCHVVVVGAGFAGLIAARELSMRGKSVILLEGRDRIGGRTWTDKRLGRDLELGGTWVHWYQPHVWAEITRYGLELTESPTPTKAYWVSRGEVHNGTAEEWVELADEPLSLAFQGAREFRGHPFKPFDAALVPGGFRDQTVTEYVEGLGLTRDQEELLRVFWALHSHGRNGEAAATHMLHGVAVYGNSWQQLMEAAGTYKIKRGTGALAFAIAGEIQGDLRLRTRVVAIEREAGVVNVLTEGGDRVATHAVIVTVPRNALRDIAFSPPLSEVKRQVIAEGQVSQGVKVWARLKGRYEPFFAFGEEDSRLQYAQAEYEIDGDTIVMAMGADARAIDASDRGAVQAEFRRWVPGVEVVGSTGHDWVADPFSQQTWFVPRPGHLIHLQEMQRPEDGVYLAGADYATADPSTIDGAVEGGLTSANRVMSYLATGAPALATSR
jgi:monoamine oxidase